jgi:hypothetical protein
VRNVEKHARFQWLIFFNYCETHPPLMRWLRGQRRERRMRRKCTRYTVECLRCPPRNYYSDRANAVRTYRPPEGQIYQRGFRDARTPEQRWRIRRVSHALADQKAHRWSTESMPVPCRYRTAVVPLRRLARAGVRSPGRRPGTKSESGSRQQFEAAWASYCEPSATPPQASKIRYLSRP